MTTPARSTSPVQVSQTNISPLVKKILGDRGYTSLESIEAFLSPRYEMLPDPFIFRDMKKAISCILQGLQERKKFFIHGDYDIDGISASVIIARTLTQAGGDVEVYYPDRQKDGYGLRMKTVKFCQENGIDIVITCDCGIRNIAEIAALEDAGIRTIVTDHHDFLEEQPAATAILHPRIPHEPFPGKLLSGAGVAWMLAAALHRSRIPGLQEGQEKWLLDLAMLGTIGDMVPLRGENRILTTFGLKVLPQSRWPGLVLLAGEKPVPHPLTSEDVSFQIIPKLNAAGRIADARIAASLLLAENAAEALPLLDQLRVINTERQRITQEMSSYGLQNVSADAPFVLMGQDHWPIGVVGLVANRLMDTVKKPVLLYGRREEDGHYVGSARSPRHIHITEVLTACSDILVEFGGHAQAAGFTIAQENIPSFRERLHGIIASASPPKDADLGKPPYPMPITECTLQTYRDLQRLQPFGIENEEPLFQFPAIVRNAKRVGSTGAHLKVRLGDPSGKIFIDAIGFFLAANDPIPKEGTRAIVTVALRENIWNGEHVVQCHLRNVEPQ